MRLTLLSHHALVESTNHHGFTDLCQWRNRYYCAYRVARTHNIVPPGEVEIRVTDARLQWYGADCWDIRHPIGDVRDPRFVVTPDVLYCLVGVYLPAPWHAQKTGTFLTQNGGDNVLMTHLTYTTDGETWADLVPILRPNYWGWNALDTEHGYLLASYHTGQVGESSSIVLWVGKSLLSMRPHATIYDGASLLQEEERFLYPHASPCEPVLYQPAPDALACCVRTEKGMEIGVSRYPWQDWRWHIAQVDYEAEDSSTSGDLLHPSAVLQTMHGLILAAREVHPVYKAVDYRGNERPGDRVTTKIDRYTTRTALYQLHGQYVTHLLTLPSGLDTGYAGICHGPEPGTVLVSWYSQKETEGNAGHGVTLPGSVVNVGTVQVEA